MKKKKRELEVCVLSDLHLGTYGCRAEEIVKYLNSIQPKLLILNGDIIDGWNFRKKYFPPSHMVVVRKLLKMMEKGTEVIYITGNHDEFLRKYSDSKLGKLKIVDKYILMLNNQKCWFFHGDIFDRTTQGYARIIAKLGGKGYDWLILFNHLMNKMRNAMGLERVSYSKRIKNSVKSAVKWIDNFEKTASELAIDEGYDIVACGHIHQPKDEIYQNENGKIRYLNSGDWVENLTSLEYCNGEWKVFYYSENEVTDLITEKEVDTILDAILEKEVSLI